MLRSGLKARSSFARLLAVRRRPLSRRHLHGLSIGVAKEDLEGEYRVGLHPENVSKLVAKGAAVSVEAGAGAASGYSDDQYTAAGATIISEEDVWKQELVVKVRQPSAEQLKKLGNRKIVAQLNTRFNPEISEQLSGQKATGIDLTMLLRTLSRGQSFDTLSSQANIAGYRSVIEAANSLQRPLAGGSTAAGRVKPCKVMVVGAGVAGLAAIQQAKNMNAIVTAFDVRAAAAEQVESMGAKFLKVESDEDGSAAGGYAKEMSEEWFEAARKMLMKECADTNVIISTALIPGRKAPILIHKEMVDIMPPGSVTVDLAAEAGGNIATTVPGEVVKLPNCTCIGYTNMNSRMAEVSSALFSTNVTKLLLSMNIEDKFQINLEDEAVRSMLVVNAGEKLEPYVPPPPPPVEEKEVVTEVVVSEQEIWRKKTMIDTLSLVSLINVGAMVPAGGMLPTFALSVYVGAGAVQGVAHSLHSPLMSITNAISGMTMIGGMMQLSGKVPTTGAQVLAFTAVSLSAINLAGGFIITKKILDLFRRPDDPPEYFHYLLAPPGVAMASYAALTMSGKGAAGLPDIMALMSGLGCVAGISAMSAQSTTRQAVFLGMGGVGMGLTATFFQVQPEAYPQLLVGSLAGGAIGAGIASTVSPTSLPQAVAGFHSLVGVAATATAVGDFLVHDISHMNAFHSGSLYMGAWMGSITATGSVIACAKLAEVMSSAPLALPNRDIMNGAMAVGSVGAMYGFITTKDPTVAASCLTAGTTLSGLLGLHMTASIGGADMPVVITLLNSYSGWALCAEGFILDQTVLTIVGALIGSSGAFLTKIMCDGMNRSLTNVILGGFGTDAGVDPGEKETRTHTEIDINGTVEALKDAERVCIVPGYGMAVSQAQYATAAIAKILTDQGKDVRFAVHPVAGRMPGQLNILLAEAGVPYDVVYEMEEINEVMPETDVTMVIGANDTVNSAAEDDPKSAIAGMPVIQVWNSKHVVFMKRSMASGYAGVQNPVFFHERTDMLLGDATKSCEGIKGGLEAAYN